MNPGKFSSQTSHSQRTSRPWEEARLVVRFFQSGANRDAANEAYARMRDSRGGYYRRGAQLTNQTKRRDPR